MASASWAVLPACDISREPQRKEKGKTLRDRRLYLLSLSRLSTSNCSPYKWCFSLSHLIVAARGGWNARSDNNMRFQLNSPMHDLCLRDCFLLQSEVLKTPTCFFLFCFFFSLFRLRLPPAPHRCLTENKLCIIWRRDTLGVVVVLLHQIGNYEGPAARTRPALIAKTATSTSISCALIEFVWKWVHAHDSLIYLFIFLLFRLGELQDAEKKCSEGPRGSRSGPVVRPAVSLRR